MKVYKNFPLAKILYYKIGGEARFLLKVQNKKDLLEALDFIKKNNITKILLIGMGSNLLVSDDGFDGAVIWFSKANNSSLQLTADGLISAFSSVSLDDLIQFSFENNMIGLEWAGGLPSTVGGAIRGNVGAFGGEIKDCLYKAEVLDISEKTLNIQEFKNADLEFSYRNSIIKKNKNLIVVTGFLNLKAADQETVEKARNIYLSHIEYRRKNHPMEFPSCGSVFKNITGKEVEKILSVWPDIKESVENTWHGKVSMGYVIRRLGFAGFKSGKAQVSEKHSNYIVNVQNATFKDVLIIIESIKGKFFATFGFYPEPEVEIVN